MIKIMASAFTYALAGIGLATLTVALMANNSINVEWAAVLLLFAVGLILLAILVEVTTVNTYRDERRCATINLLQWATIGVFMLGIVGAIIKVVWLLYAIFG